MRAMCLALSVAFVPFVGMVTAQPGPQKVDDKKLVTKVYNAKSLLTAGKGGGVADLDVLVKLVLETVSIGEPKPDGTGAQLVQRDGDKLEVRATEKVHGEIKDLLDALTRLQDLAVDVKAEVIEFDLATYKKFVAVVPQGKSKPPVLFAAGEGAPGAAVDPVPEAALKLLKGARVVQTSGGRFANGIDSTVSARKAIVPFSNDPNAVSVGAKTSNPLFVKEGFALNSLSIVSTDRRSVRMKLTESSTAVTGMRTRELLELEGKKWVAQSLDTEDLGATGSAVVPDGGTVVFKLAYAPKDKVWVVVLTPTIFIQAEEDQLKIEGKSVSPR